MKDLKKAALTEAKKIAEQLIKSAIYDRNGLHWKCYAPLKGWNEEDITIYSGNSGILLFFMHLYAVTKDERYRIILEKGTNWLIESGEVSKVNDTSLFLGHLGAAFYLSKYYQIIPDDRVKDSVLSICRQINTSLDAPSTAELLSGDSGRLIGLLHIYQSISDGDLMVSINQLFRRMIGKVKFSEVGVYFDKSISHKKPLNGLSHGTSGVVLLLSAIYGALKSPDLKWLIENLIGFEDINYDNRAQNWPDYRGLGHSKAFENLVEAYRKNNLTSYKKKRFYHTWCHGSPGIILSRIRYYDETKNEKVLSKLSNSLIRAYKKNHINDSPTICCGTGGILYSMIEVNQKLSDIGLQSRIDDLLRAVLDRRKKIGYYKSGWGQLAGEEPSLFKGIAGVGLLMLRYYKNLDHSIVYPDLNLNDMIQDFNFDLHLDDFLLNSFPNSHTFLSEILGKEVFTLKALAKKKHVKVIKKGRLRHLNKDIANLKKALKMDYPLLKAQYHYSQETLLAINDFYEVRNTMCLIKSMGVFKENGSIVQLNFKGQQVGYDDNDGVYGYIINYFSSKNTLDQFCQESKEVFETDGDGYDELIYELIKDCIQNGLLTILP